MSSSSDDEPTPKRKRGIVHEDTYKRNVIRTARVKGEGYVTYKGKVVEKKMVPDHITCKCSGKCYLLLNEETTRQIWSYFYSLENKNAQDIYLQTLIEFREIKRRRKRHDNPQEQPSFTKNHSYIYYLKVNGVLKPVCKNVFMKAHGVSADRLSRICKLLLKNKTPNDMRGKNRSGNAINGEVCVKIHEHISKFEVKDTHYEEKTKKYLDARLNLVKMHKMFQDDCPNLKDVVKYNFYYHYFKENFDYSFGRPQVDVCSQCESLGMKLKDPNLNENAKRNVAAELMLHKRRSKKFYVALKTATANKNDDTAVLSFDYMQNLPLPLISVQEIFYLRQLWVNVFCIHDMKTNKVKLYLYHEGEARKSPNEVCSFLLHYIQTEIPSTVKNVILFSDGAAGQSKNHTVVRFLMNLCDRGRFDTITHYFPVRGHSFLPCDRDFGSIKRHLRKTDRIYTPDEYAQLIVQASRIGRFSIHQVETHEILCFKDWWPRYYKKTTNSDETSGRRIPKDQKMQFKIASYKQFLFSKEIPGKVVAKLYPDGAFSSTFTLRKTNKPPELPFLKAYPEGKVPINKKKLEDLKKLSDYTRGYEHFYDNVLRWPTTETECTLDSDFEEA